MDEKWLGAYSFAWGSAHNAQVVVHEAGHALAAQALLQNANTKITLFPYNGGVTNIRWKGCRDCHVQNDWVLIYKIDQKERTITFIRLGSHSELFH